MIVSVYEEQEAFAPDTKWFLIGIRETWAGHPVIVGKTTSEREACDLRDELQQNPDIAQTLYKEGADRARTA